MGRNVEGIRVMELVQDYLDVVNPTGYACMECVHWYKDTDVGWCECRNEDDPHDCAVAQSNDFMRFKEEIEDEDE